MTSWTVWVLPSVLERKGTEWLEGTARREDEHIHPEDAVRVRTNRNLPDDGALYIMRDDVFEWPRSRKFDIR